TTPACPKNRCRRRWGLRRATLRSRWARSSIEDPPCASCRRPAARRRLSRTSRESARREPSRTPPERVRATRGRSLCDGDLEHVVLHRQDRQLLLLVGDAEQRLAEILSSAEVRHFVFLRALLEVAVRGDAAHVRDLLDRR